MIYLRIGDHNVEFRFDYYSKALDNHWAIWSLDESERHFQKMVNSLSENKIHKMKDTTDYFIKGLNEKAMYSHYRQAKGREGDGMLDKSVVFKGTRFGRRYNIFSAYAALLKAGLPENISVKSGVVAVWDREALEKYIVRITKAIGY